MSDIDVFAPAVPPPAPVRRRRRGRLRDKLVAIVGLAMVAAMSLAALLAPVLAPHNPNAVDLARRFELPSWDFPLGTDELGRDIASRMLFGGRLSIGSTLVASAAIAVIGLVVGMVAGYAGGWVDTVASRTIDALLGFPYFLLALVLTGFLGPGLVQVTLALVLVGWASFARVVRSIVISERERAYVEAARALGSSHIQIACRHVLPAVVGPLLVYTTLEMAGVLLTLSAFSFLGLGVSPPTAEWGSMLSEASAYLGRAPYMMIPPGAAIFVLVLGFNLLGDGLRDVLDPRTKMHRRR